jgi:hypothetical protein
MLQFEENHQNIRLRRSKRGPKKRNKGYFKGNKPELLCGTPEQYNFVQRSKIFRKSSLGVYAQTAVRKFNYLTPDEKYYSLVAVDT